MKARGRPILGAIAGLVFGLSLALLLLVLGIVALDSILLSILPLAGLVFGILWAFVAPLGPRRPPEGWREKIEAPST